MKTNSPLLTVFSFLLGAGLFFLMVRYAGSAELWSRIQQLDARFIAVLLVAGLRPVIRSAAWWLCLPTENRSKVFYSLWQARLIGDAIGNLTTAGPLLAEPSRLLVLSGLLPLGVATASLSLELLSYLWSACLMMLVGLLALLAVFALDSSLRLASLLSLLLLLAAIGGIAFIVWQRWSFVAGAQRASQRLGHYFGARVQLTIENTFGRLQAIESHIFAFARQQPRRFAIVCLCEMSFHLLGVIEIGLTLWLMGVSYSWLAAFIFESVNRLVNIVFAFVPIKLGVDEAGTALLAQVLGFSPSIGVTLALYRKVRVLFWTIIGLLLLGHQYALRRNKQI